MAEFDPRDHSKSPGFNTWGFAGVPKENDFYDFLDETKKKTDAFFETINLIFDLVNSALDFIASLLIDFTNPLKPIIEEIIAILEAFIHDLRNLGLYFTYDKKELKNPAEHLLGGYPAFEQRVIKKLLNNKDKTRPDFSPETKVFAMTFFAGADASGIKKIIDAIMKLLKLFQSGKSDEKPKAPINVEAIFYNDIVGEIELPNAYKPDGIRIKWKLPPPTSTNKLLPSAFVLPDYFLFSVATRIGDQIGYVNKVVRTTGDPKIEMGERYKSNLQTNVVGGDARLWPIFNSINYTKLNESKTYIT